MQQGLNFFAKVIVLVTAVFGVSTFLFGARDGRGIGGMGRDGSYYDRERYQQTDSERHLDMIRVRVEQRKALTARKTETEQQIAKLFKAKKFLSDNGKDKTSFVTEFKRLYRKSSTAKPGDVAYEFEARDINRFVNLLNSEKFDTEKGTLKTTFEEEKRVADQLLERLNKELEVDIASDAVRLEKSNRRDRAQSSVEKLVAFIAALEQANSKEELKALLGISRDVSPADDELERLFSTLDACDDASYALKKTQQEQALAREIEQQEALLKEMENYDSISNVLFRAFLPDEFDGVTATGVTSKVGLALAIPMVTAVRKSLDAEYGRFSNRMVRYMGERVHDFAVYVGLASPLTTKKVASWSRTVASFKKSMENLAKNSADSTDVAAAFGARAANRPEKPALGAGVQGSDSDMAAQVNAADEVDEVVEFMRHADPVYVRVSSDFVRQMRRQITVVLRRMNSDSYAEQREILSDVLKMLDCVGYLATGSFKVYRQVGLTQVLNRDISACCEWLSAQLSMLKDLITSAEEDDAGTSPTTSTYGGKSNRLGADW